MALQEIITLKFISKENIASAAILALLFAVQSAWTGVLAWTLLLRHLYQ